MATGYAAQSSIPEATTGYWSFTKHMLVQSQRMSTTPAARIVDALDPDATSKSGGHLASDDAKPAAIPIYALVVSKRTLNCIDAHISHGELPAYGVYYCLGGMRYVRVLFVVYGSGLARTHISAVLHRAFHLVLTSRHELTQMTATDPTDTVDDEDEAMDNYVWSGNRHRKLWKSTCTRAALNPNLPKLERTLYAALCPSPQTFPILRSACKIWEDHIWATLSLVLGRTEQDRDDSGELNSPLRPNHYLNSHTNNDESDWENEVFSTHSSLQTTSVLSGPPAFHFSQLHIMLGRTSTLLDVFAGGLNDGVYGPGMEEDVPLCRFFAHLSLYLGLLDVSVPVGAVQTVLEAYSRVLEDAGERHLIALYAGALGKNAVERYALFLVSLRSEAGMGMRIDGVDGGDSIEEGKRALLRAREHGLDVNRVAVVAAEQSLDKAFEVRYFSCPTFKVLFLPASKGPLPSLVGPESDNPLQRPPSYTETFLICSIEWTTFSEATYATALEQAFVVLRFFLASGRLKLAQSVLDMLPAKLASISEPEERATEWGRGSAGAGD
ncbi:107-domain-containing protein [Amanita rubescens]|nr:107-domain-containing protein [Amanita rubescens]